MPPQGTSIMLLMPSSRMTVSSSLRVTTVFSSDEPEPLPLPSSPHIESARSGHAGAPLPVTVSSRRDAPGQRAHAGRNISYGMRSWQAWWLQLTGIDGLERFLNRGVGGTERLQLAAQGGQLGELRRHPNFLKGQPVLEARDLVVHQAHGQHQRQGGKERAGVAPHACWCKGTGRAGDHGYVLHERLSVASLLLGPAARQQGQETGG